MFILINYHVDLTQVTVTSIDGLRSGDQQERNPRVRFVLLFVVNKLFLVEVYLVNHSISPEQQHKGGKIDHFYRNLSTQLACIKSGVRHTLN